jgi:hypothetical protein
MDLIPIDQAMHFPFGVIKLPKELYHIQSKTEMRVASANMGGIGHDGPSRTHLACWKHIAIFYIFELLSESYYLAQSLTCHPHYIILRSEMPAFEACLKAFFKKDGSSRIKRISIKENFRDDFLVVLNNLDQYPLIREYLLTIDDSHLLQRLASHATADKT